MTQGNFDGMGASAPAPKEWDLDDKDTWLEDGDPNDREDMRRLYLQACRSAPTSYP